LKALDRIIGFVLLAIVMAAGGLFIVERFGVGLDMPGWARNGGLLLGGASAVYVLWQLFADGLAAWREAGGVGFTVRLAQRLFVGFIRSVVGPVLAAAAAVSGTWNVLNEVGTRYGDLAQAAATTLVMIGAASLAFISRLPESEPRKE
jgi:hypothetical protein